MAIRINGVKKTKIRPTATAAVGPAPGTFVDGSTPYTVN